MRSSPDLPITFVQLAEGGPSALLRIGGHFEEDGTSLARFPLRFTEGGSTMDLHRKASADEPPGAKPATPRGSPATDPTNPFRQEAAGIHATAEETNERKAAEPGLTDADRDRRGASR
jgi:hypothetical protein